MVFNSIPFALFLPIVFGIYWLIGTEKVRYQNFFLLISCCFFYGWWDWRFLSLLFFSISFSYFIGFKISQSESSKKKKLFLWLGVILILILLSFFKYYNFFIESFANAFSLFGKPIHLQSLKIILPLGISFYTFKILGYLLDVYSKRIEVTKNFINYSLFVSFFPQLVAGPIEKAEILIPQIESKRYFDYNRSAEALKLILWGLFKKIVIADSCALYVNDIFSNYQVFPASVLLLGTVYFAFQVYADFSGYSDIASGVAKLFGFDIMTNFNRPFVSKNVTEFWRRWHISLSVWFNDYVFTPLYTAMRNWGMIAMYISIFLTFLLSGLWHGDQWHYVMFGVIHAIALIFEAATKKRRKKLAKHFSPKIYGGISIILTFSFLLITWIMFRAESVTHALSYSRAIFDSSIIEIPSKLAYIPFIILLVLWEWVQRKKKHTLDFPKLGVTFRWGIYLCLTFSILYFYGQEQAFYYFQF